MAESRAVGGHEVARKAIHLAATIIAALIVLRVPAPHARAALLAATAVAITVEVVRRVSPRTNRLFNRALGSMLRTREAGRVTGATTLAAGFLATALVAPPNLAAAAILMAGVGDAAGALVGRNFGRIHLPGGKSIEGSIACLVAATLTALAVPDVTPVLALAGALVTTTLEAAAGRFDDNLLLPPATALAMLALSSVL